MTTMAALDELDGAFRRLQVTLEGLQWAVVEAQPVQAPGHAVVDHYTNAVEDLLGSVREARKAVTAARLAIRRSTSRAASEPLAVAGRCYADLWAQLYEATASPVRARDLDRLSRSEAAWQTWTKGVVDALDQCPSSLYEIGLTLISCWEDLIEGAGVPPLTVQVLQPQSGVAEHPATDLSSRKQ